MLDRIIFQCRFRWGNTQIHCMKKCQAHRHLLKVPKILYLSSFFQERILFSLFRIGAKFESFLRVRGQRSIQKLPFLPDNVMLMPYCIMATSDRLKIYPLDSIHQTMCVYYPCFLRTSKFSLPFSHIDQRPKSQGGVFFP